MEKTIFENIISNFWYALAALSIATLLFHVLFVWLQNLSKKQWKKVDYIWISLTAMGLIGTTRIAEKTISQNNSYAIKYEMAFNTKELLYHLTPENSSWVCRTFVKDKYSPENLEDLQLKYDAACEWRTKVAKVVVNAIDSPKLEIIDVKKLPELVENDSQIKTFKKIVLDYIKQYNNCVTALQKNADLQQNGDSDIIMIYFSPILLILGLALRITKVTGELKYEK
jgi:hypothetical protein